MESWKHKFLQGDIYNLKSNGKENLKYSLHRDHFDSLSTKWQNQVLLPAWKNVCRCRNSSKIKPKKKKYEKETYNISVMVHMLKYIIYIGIHRQHNFTAWRRVQNISCKEKAELFLLNVSFWYLLQHSYKFYKSVVSKINRL